MRQAIVTSFSIAALTLFVFGYAQAETAKDIYRAYCAQCHGINGDGLGINTPDLTVQPRNHTDAKEMSTRTDEELFKVIKEGGKSIKKSILMPAWKETLSDKEITGLVQYLRELCRCRFGSAS